MSRISQTREKIAALLKEQSTLALSTVDSNGQACVAPLFYIADEEFSLYWISSESSLHSANLKLHPNAAVTVYANTEKWQEIRGVQMRGMVMVIKDKTQRSDLIKKYCRRFQLKNLFRLAISRSTLFAFRPDFIRYTDNSEKFGFRIELKRHTEEEWRIAK